MSLVTHVAFDPSTGRISGYATGPVVAIGGMALTVTGARVHHDQHYVDINMHGCPVIDRPQMGIELSKTEIAADQTDETVFTGIPDGSILDHEGASHEVRGGILTFAAEHPGEYRFRFTLFPFVAQDFTVTARAAQ